MCTAISYKPNHHYFGRNLDLEHHYSEEVTITPRNFPFKFRATKPQDCHYAMIGIATIMDSYPLYYDATNEFGLSIAALNFPGNAVYNDINENIINISAFELIPYLLGMFRSVDEVKTALNKINIVSIPFNDKLPLTPLHWFVADKKKSITIEQTADGLQVYDNPINVLTNNPPFPYHIQNLNNYLNLTTEEPENRFNDNLKLSKYGRGMGAIGLPGDLSSASRFVRAAFVLHNSNIQDNKQDEISQFFHILGSVEQQNGCVRVGDLFEKTVYTSCCDTDSGIYYYTTYDNRQITAVDMRQRNLNATSLIHYPLRFKQQIYQE